jgi:hypothetical protein
MRRVRKLFSLSRAERWLLVRAFLIVGMIRLGLWLLPFRILRPLLARLTPDSTSSRDNDEPAAERVAWAVSAAAVYVPSASCLTQALAAQALLAQRGEPADLRIGVARDELLGITAHAWLESRGKVVIGGQLLERYVPLSPLGEREWQARPAAQTAGRMEVG